MEIKKPVNSKQVSKITTSATELKVQRLKVYQLIEAGKLDFILIDNSPFVVKNKKYEEVKNG